MKKSKTKFLMLGVIACMLAIISVWVFSWVGSLVPRWADAVIAYDESFGRPPEGSKARHNAYDGIVGLCRSLPHVIERNKTK